MQVVGRYKRYLQLGLVLVVFITISFAVASVPTDDLISWVGSDRAWMIMLVLGAIGGLSTFVGIPYHLVLMSLASGGVNPVGLGLATAAGVMMGDSVMFGLSRGVKNSLTGEQIARVEAYRAYVERYPRLVTPALVLYGTFSPLSNDFVVAGLSMMNYRYWQIIVPLALGNTVYNISLAYIGLYAYSSLFGV